MNARAEFLPPNESSSLRVPPNSAEAETAVLGGLLLDGTAWDRIGDILAERDFFRTEHRVIFAAVASLANASKTTDPVSVFDQLQRFGQAEQAGGMAYLDALAQYRPSVGNLRRYAEIVRERSILRQLVTAADEIATKAFNPQGETVDSILDEAAQKVMGINPEAASDEWQSMQQMVVTELDMISDRESGTESDREPDYIPTGLSVLDGMLDGGLRPGQLVIVGARPGMGKSAIADTIGINVARQGLPVGKFSMEMQNHESGQRAISAVGKIPLHALRRPERMSNEHWSRLTNAVETLSQLPFFSNDRGGLNINQVRAKARALKRRHGLRLLVVDYLQLMSGTDSRAPRTYQLEEASRGLKALAKELGIPILALVQVNRGVEKETDPMPRLSDIKDCGSIEQDADVVVFLHRPIVASPDLSDDWRYYARARVAKQRGGRIGDLDLQYIGENTRFTDWPAGMAVPVNPVRVKREPKNEL
jgi:replicative DNA helicase